MVHATDTGVVVIAVAVSSILQNFEVWIAFGHGNNLRYIPCHRISNKLGTEASCGLLFFHDVSGCYTVSAFRRVGKKTATAIWRSMSPLDQIFVRLSHAPKQIFTEDLKQLERVVVLLYQRTSTEMLYPLLNKVWEQEQVPEDWKKGHMVKLPKKGDMSSCNNWRGVMLLSIPGKVLTRIN